METTIENPTINTEKAREEFTALINSVRYDGKHLRITKKGKPVAALIPIADLEFYEEMEDRLDIKAAEEAMKEQGDEPLTDWEDFEKELDGK